MNFKELFHLSRKPANPTRLTRIRHPQEKEFSRRQLLEMTVLALGGTVLTATGVYKLVDNLTKEDDKETTYSMYLSSFESIARGDEEAENLLDFFKKRRKKGIVRNENFFKLEEGDPEIDFYTAIIKPNEKVYGERLGGFAEFKQTLTPPVLFLKDVAIDPLFAGITMIHEARHVYQWLTGIEQNRTNGFVWGELEARETEIRLLDKATKGRFSQILEEQAKTIEKGKYRAMLSREDLEKISALFSPPKSIEEDYMRYTLYVIALNLVRYKSQSASVDEANRERLKYIQGIYTGETKIFRPD